MLASEAISLLKESELKNLKVSETDTTILGYINMGILELHKRFLLWEGEATVTMVSGTTTYTLDGTDTNVSIDLTKNELIKIESIDDALGDTLFFNEGKDSIKIKTPLFNKIKTYTDLDVQVLAVTYRAAPKFLTAVTETIPLPIQFLEALFLYVGFKGHSSIKASTKDSDNAYYIRFEASCNKLKNNGLNIQDDLSSNKFDKRGFA